jgi:uncharacterized protein (TIGR03435 family)
MLRSAMILVAISGVALVAQNVAPPLTFEVASVRLNTSGSAQQSMGWPKGSFSATNMPLRLLIAFAYGIQGQFQTRFRVVGGPEELLAER